MAQAEHAFEMERLSDYLRIEETDGGYRLSAREEVGRGKRFGAAGSIEITPVEAAGLVRWLIVNLDDRAFIEN